MLKSCKNKLLCVISMIITLFLLDIITKYIFTSKYYFNEFFISIYYSENYGSALSMFSNVSMYNSIIIILSIVVIIGIIYNTRNFQKNGYYISIFILLISGILGNLYDRIFFGFVRDFISLKYLFIFNIADIYLTLAVILLISIEFRVKSKD